jgi:uncharacterized protein YfaS (alpha-2-macroglobulin family)
VDALAGDQKLEEASREVGALLERARAAGDAPAWTRALVKRLQLRLALQGYESAVEELRDSPWPQDTLSQVTLELAYAQALDAYVQAYDFELRQRERVAGEGRRPLKQWTREEVEAEANRAFLKAWEARAALGQTPVSALADVLKPNTYPPEIRGTLRDALSYLFVEQLLDASRWRPEHAAGLYRLDFPGLVRGDAASASRVNLGDEEVHPLVRAMAVLADLEAWHRGLHQPGAELEARLARVRALAQHFPAQDKLEVLEADLANRLVPFRKDAWWSEGMATRADLLESAGKRPAARSVAQEGAKAFPHSFGGERCAAKVSALERPELSLDVMSVDGLGKRSIQVRYKNLTHVYFRAYRVDVEAALKSGGYTLYLGEAPLRALVAQAPSAQWEEALPATEDLDTHGAFVVPRVQGWGTYRLLASTRPDFDLDRGPVAVTTLQLTSMVLLTDREGAVPTFVPLRPAEGAVPVYRVVDGEKGQGLAGVSVAVYQGPSGRVQSQVTSGAEGRFSVQPPSNGSCPCWLLLRQGKQTLLAMQESSSPGAQSEPQDEGFVYTDRAVYRPLQKIAWKVVAFRGTPTRTSFHALPARQITVRLLDANGQEVASRKVTTNRFGSAAGEFDIPAGRLLGEWQIQTDLQRHSGAAWGGAAARVRVEEYKRPTFTVTLDPPSQALRLNQAAALRGHAAYYFGQAVTAGQVVWKVSRVPIYLLGGLWRPRPAQEQVVASGAAPVEADGGFQWSFRPEGDESEKASGVSYRYRAQVSLTDESGESHTADRVFNIGFVAVKASIEAGKGFLPEHAAQEVVVTREDLDGNPAPGVGRWSLFRLEAPKVTLLPSEYPADGEGRSSMEVLFGRGGVGTDRTSGGSNADGGFHTPGDLQRPRWQHPPSSEDAMSRWPAGAAIAEGRLHHDERGRATVSLPGLEAGAYRLTYWSTDAFGGTFELHRELVVEGSTLALPVPLMLRVETPTGQVGGKARLLVQSGYPGQEVWLTVFRNRVAVSQRQWVAGKDAPLWELPLTEDDRGGLSFRAVAVHDYQLLQANQDLSVPWTNKELQLSFSTFRDSLTPGKEESWRLTLKGANGRILERGAAEVLASMYDESLDLFGLPQVPHIVSLYPNGTGLPYLSASLGHWGAPTLGLARSPVLQQPTLQPDAWVSLSPYGIGGMGQRGLRFRPGGIGGIALRKSAQPLALFGRLAGAPPEAASPASEEARDSGRGDQVSPRQNFAETAFWFPQLLAGADGTVHLDFHVPDSVTRWHVWAEALTEDLRGGSVDAHAESKKPLMVRPAVPRFLRAGDAAELAVMVDNTSSRPLRGRVTLAVEDPNTHERLNGSFGVTSPERPFSVEPGKSVPVSFRLKTPARLGLVAFRVVGTAGSESDGELRPVPVLPSRVHLSSSRSVALQGRETRELSLPALGATDPTRRDEQLVVTVRGQLFYGLLQALPYLVHYPFECTEQTLNRFVSTGILSSLFSQYPVVRKMAEALPARASVLETFDAQDANRRLAFEETPWLAQSRGGAATEDVLAVVNPKVAEAERQAALLKLRKAQLPSGAFPWWPGGPASRDMTLYLLSGLARAAELHVDVAKDMVSRAFTYLKGELREANVDWDREVELVTYVNYVASSFTDEAFLGGAFPRDERLRMLDVSFKHWREHAPYLKGMLALTLARMGRREDAWTVFASVMDSAKTTRDEGTFWAPDAQSWLWYHDTLSSHAFALRVLLELRPEDPRARGLVQWLFLNKTLNHWKSTRATAEVLASVARYLVDRHELGQAEAAEVSFGGARAELSFDPKHFEGKQQWEVPLDGGRPREQGRGAADQEAAAVRVKQLSSGLMFASATYGFSTERLPAQGDGDLFHVERSYFRRETRGKETVLHPWTEGSALSPGDELEVHLEVTSRHPAEYVHLRDPRGAGFEPVERTSGYRWQTGMPWYEEVHDSATSFFIEKLPQGRYTLTYRVRASMEGEFRVGPATLQSLYAPEFSAYSQGQVLRVR